MHLTFLCLGLVCCFFFFFFHDTATTEIYTLSLHDALPIWAVVHQIIVAAAGRRRRGTAAELADVGAGDKAAPRSEEHTSELQSLRHLVCRLLLEKKKKTHKSNTKRQKTRKTRHITTHRPHE